MHQNYGFYIKAHASTNSSTHYYNSRKINVTPHSTFVQHSFTVLRIQRGKHLTHE